MDFSLDFSGLADIARDLETLSRAEMRFTGALWSWER